MKVVLELDDRTWWMIAERAEKNGMRTAELLKKVLEGTIPTQPTARVQKPQTVKTVEPHSEPLAKETHKPVSTKKHSRQIPIATTQLLMMHSQGFHDGQISVALNKTRAWVAETRRFYGLKPNSPYKKKEK